MITRRTLTFLILSIALLAPATAQAEKPKPVRNVPKLFLTLTDGAMNNKTVRPTITTTFAPPAGTTAAAACKGKVLVKAATGKKTLKKKKVTVYAKNSASVKNVAGLCTSAAALKLPAALKDKSVTFKAVFSGNSAVKGFAKSSKLKVTPTPIITPPVPAAPTIHAGVWVARLIIGLPDYDPRWQFEIKPDGSVSGIAMTGLYTATCPAGYSNTLANFSHTTPFGFVGDLKEVQFNESGAGLGGSIYDVTTKFRFALNSNGTGFGTFSASGYYMITLSGGGPYITAKCSFAEDELMLTRLQEGSD